MPKENTANQSFPRPDQSLTTLFSRLTDDLTELFDAKLELLKTELKEEMTSFASGASLIVGGAVVGVIGFAFLNVGIAFFVSMLRLEPELVAKNPDNAAARCHRRVLIESPAQSNNCKNLVFL